MVRHFYALENVEMCGERKRDGKDGELTLSFFSFYYLIHKYKYTHENTKIQVHKYKNTQTHKHTNTAYDKVPEKTHHVVYF